MLLNPLVLVAHLQINVDKTLLRTLLAFSLWDLRGCFESVFPSSIVFLGARPASLQLICGLRTLKSGSDSISWPRSH